MNNEIHKPIQTKYLGHRASGNGKTVINNKIVYENTFAAVVEGLKIFDGIEIDIQMSKDNTIWVFHDSKLPQNSKTDSLICIPQSFDWQIDSFNVSADSKIPRLSDVFDYVKRENIEKPISLDIKGYFDSDCFAHNSADNKYFERFARQLSQLFRTYNLYAFVMLETDYTYIFDCLKKTDPEINCYLLAYNNFDTKIDIALKNNYAGVSFNFSDTSVNAAKIKAAQAKGLKIQLWTPDSETLLLQAKAMNADFIQTNNLNFKQICND